MSQKSNLHEGDKVTFNIGQNQLEGTVSEVLTKPTEVDGRIAHASKDEPRVVVHYDATNGDVIRTVDNVEKVKEDDGVHEGDRVTFNIGQNQLEGTVSEVLTKPTEVDGRIAHASKDEPRVAVHYDGTNHDIIRTMNSVDKVDDHHSSGSSKSSSSSKTSSSPSKTSSSPSKSSSSSSSSSSGSEVHEGDRVNFNIGQNRLEGTVIDVLKSPAEVGGRIAHASKDEPRIAVQYDNGTEIIRTMKQVEKIDQGEEDQEDKEISIGDRVAFHIGQNRLEGTIKKVLTSPSNVEGRVAHASEEEPRYVIHYEGTNSDLIRTENSVEKMDEGERMNTDQSGKRKRDDEEDVEGESSDNSQKSKGSNKEPDSKKQKNTSRRKGTSSH